MAAIVWVGGMVKGQWEVPWPWSIIVVCFAMSGMIICWALATEEEQKIEQTTERRRQFMATFGVAPESLSPESIQAVRTRLDELRIALRQAKDELNDAIIIIVASVLEYIREQERQLRKPSISRWNSIRGFSVVKVRKYGSWIESAALFVFWIPGVVEKERHRVLQKLEELLPKLLCLSFHSFICYIQSHGISYFLRRAGASFASACFA